MRVKHKHSLHALHGACVQAWVRVPEACTHKCVQWDVLNRKDVRNATNVLIRMVVLNRMDRPNRMDGRNRIDGAKQNARDERNS